MPEAWVVRSGQQQWFVDSLVKKYHDRLNRFAETIKTTDSKEFERGAKRQHEEFNSDLLAMMLKPHDVLLLRNPWAENLVVRAFFIQIQTDISRFARTPEEMTILLQRFFLGIFLIRCAEINDPQKIFHAPPAMTEMEIPEDV